MPEPTALATGWYSYAIIRVVPRVERGEAVNVGVVLFARTMRYLQARVDLPLARLAALAPTLDLPAVERHLAAFQAVAAGDANAGPVAALPPSERFHWLTAPRSTIIQTSPVHVGYSADPAAALGYLMDCIVR
ncbi:MAG: DUF3037 domain-containing protein [Dehalococcoidia bacterium]|nr:DUF3037 domain-containing protein [Dehalococcoidia bacterium]